MSGDDHKKKAALRNLTMQASDFSATSKMAQQLKQNGTFATVSSMQEQVGMAAAIRTAELSNFTALTRSVENSGILALQRSLAAFSTTVKADVLAGLAPRSESLRVIEKMRLENQRVAEAARLAINAHMLRYSEIAKLTRVIGTSGFSKAIANANSFHGLGLPKTFGSEFQSTIEVIRSQARSIATIDVSQFQKIRDGHSEALERLLARSIEIQEELLEEQKTASGDVANSNRVQTALAIVGVLINIVVLVITMIGTFVDEGEAEEFAAIETNTTAIEDLRTQFAEMATQYEGLIESQNNDAEREAKSDDEIANILREIALSLEDLSEDDERASAPASPSSSTLLPDQNDVDGDKSD